MSQPPPPPNQPPSGGFGGSQDPSYGYPQQQGGGTPPPGSPPTPPSGPPSTPPPGQPPTPPPGGGYGYPQTPPPAGGYGYPQTPPPGQPNPYGQAAPNPYGQPPTTPMPTAGGPKGGSNKKLMVILASVVAVAVIAVGTVFFVTKDDSGDEAKGDGKGTNQNPTGGDGDGDDGGDVDVSGDPKALLDVPPETIPKPTDGEADIAWSADMPKDATAERSKQVHGLLFYGGNVIKYEPDGLRAYNIKSGDEAWFVKAVRGDSCTMASTSGNAGKTLVQWGAKCEKVMGVDLAKGKEMWKKDLPERNGDVALADYASVAVSGNLGGITWGGGNIGFRLTDGKEVWSNQGYDTCRDEGYTGGTAFLVYNECLRGDSTFLKYDQNGKKTAEWKVPEGAVVERVLSTDPIVVTLSQKGKSSRLIANIAVLSDDLKLTKRIVVDPERYNYACSPTHTMDGCHNTVVDKDSNQLFLETETYEGKERRTTAVVAYDLKSGKIKWTSEPTEDGQVSPIGMHDGKLVALERGSYSGGGGLTQLDLKKGKVEPFLSFSADEREQARDYSIVPYWVDNTLFLTTPRMYNKADLDKIWLTAIR